jgi:hypothetical protein
MTAITSSNARRLLVGALTLGVLGGGAVVTAPAFAAPDARTASLQICVRGTHGHPATITISRAGAKVRSFRLAGCTTKKVPVGKYKVTQKAPRGYRTAAVFGESGLVGTDSGQISAAYARRVKPTKRTVSQPAFVERAAHPSISFADKPN